MNKRILKLEDYGISNKRFKELSGFCEQYPEWLKKIENEKDKDKRELLLRKITLIEETARKAEKDLSEYIIKSVCFERPLKYLICVDEMPCSRSSFYDARRYFFYLLDKKI